MRKLKFKGFVEPRENWSKLPHALIDVLPLIETISEAKVILYILRHTWGFQDDEKKITLDEFCNGRKRRDRTRLDQGTGLTIPSVRAGIQAAIKHGFITVEVDKSDLGRVKKFYSLAARKFQSEGKRFSSREKKFFHRSEKETKEKNLQGKNVHPERGNGETIKAGRRSHFQGKFADLVRLEREKREAEKEDQGS